MKKYLASAILAAGTMIGGKAYADDQDKSEKNMPVEISKKIELNDQLDLRLFSGKGSGLLVTEEGKSIQEHLGIDLEFKLGKLVPYVRGKVNTVGYDFNLPFPEGEMGRNMSVDGGAGLKFNLYEGKGMKITLDTAGGYDSMMGEHYSGGIGIEW